MIVRRERPQDVAKVRSVVAAAFGVQRHGDGPGDEFPAEVTLLDALRRDDGWLPALSLVALDPNRPVDVVGHVTCTRGRVAGRPGLGLGPLAVRPERQRCGVGTALMHAVLGAADALDEPFVALLGDPAYYARFGFVAGASMGVEPSDPAWGRHFQVRTLSAWVPVSGTFRYAAPFERL
jgi:putative acetyltransferase